MNEIKSIVLYPYFLLMCTGTSKNIVLRDVAGDCNLPNHGYYYTCAVLGEVTAGKLSITFVGLGNFRYLLFVKLQLLPSRLLNSISLVIKPHLAEKHIQGW